MNVTLIFSLDRYKAVIDAFLTGLEQAIENGHDVTKLASVASFFVSRVDTEVDKRLDAIGTDEAKALKGKAGDRQRPARVPGVRGDLRHRPLARDRDRRRQAAASAVGVHRRQGPGVPATLYVDNLVTRGVVNTMPEATHRTRPPSTARSPVTRSAANYAADRKVIDDLEKLGISYDEVVQVLEDEGVAKFDASWSELQDTVTASLKAGAK